MLNNVSKMEKIMFLIFLNVFVFYIIYEDIFVYIDINIIMNRFGNCYVFIIVFFLFIYLLFIN